MAKIKIKQTGSPIRRTADQRETLVGLGLNKMHRTVELEDTPEVRGMIRKVQHMVTVEELTLRASSRRRPGSSVPDALLHVRSWSETESQPSLGQARQKRKRVQRHETQRHP